MHFVAASMCRLFFFIISLCYKYRLQTESLAQKHIIADDVCDFNSMYPKDTLRFPSERKDGIFHSMMSRKQLSLSVRQWKKSFFLKPVTSISKLKV